ncbi:kinase-like protein [Lentinus tigrinus ALCF2SS1-7]|uniref:kinase-like protein n=1 Tax=Lentinus tigrinus ALCF2SS1-7 TaxID=1328758 RepID=UPI00116632F1|nr:kinase-like protein [Lentinus tigrinus ALCF2SS1-7]
MTDYSRPPRKEDPHKDHPLYYKNVEGGLFEKDFFWREHQQWLADAGYLLRPRWREDWQPSWLNTDKLYFRCEDGNSILRSSIIDATRISDGQIVAIKKVEKSYTPSEESIIRLFSTEPLASDPHNRTVPLYDVLQSPLDSNITLLVMPYLVRTHEYKFVTVGEAVECFRQLFEGLQFIHHHLVAHCDIHVVNFLMEPTPLLSEIPHPARRNQRSYDFKRKVKRRTRTEFPTRYHIIDFGLSRRFSPGDELVAPVSYGGDKSVPEYKDPSRAVSNPFAIDVYCLGNMIREWFMDESRGSLDFLKPLIDDMTRKVPEERPTIDEAFKHFEELRISLSEWTLRSRFVYRKEFLVGRMYRACRHVIRTAKYRYRGLPALPIPPSLPSRASTF